MQKYLPVAVPILLFFLHRPPSCLCSSCNNYSLQCNLQSLFYADFVRGRYCTFCLLWWIGIEMSNFVIHRRSVFWYTMFTSADAKRNARDLILFFASLSSREDRMMVIRQDGWISPRLLAPRAHSLILPVRATDKDSPVQPTEAHPQPTETGTGRKY